MYGAKESTHSQVITLFEKFFLMIYWYITVPDPDLEIRAGGREGGGGYPWPLDNGGAQSQNVLVWSENKGAGPPALPWIRHCIKLNQML